MNFISDPVNQLDSGNAVSYGDIYEKEQAQDVSTCLGLLKWAAKSNDPEGRLLHAALIERIKQPPSDKKTLEHTLGLASAGQGQLSTFTKVKTVIRNHYLSCAVKYLEQKHVCSVWAACGLLSKAMQTFKTIKFKRIQDGNRAISNELEQHLFDVFMIDEQPPTTQSYLYEIFSKLERIEPIKPS